jgi:hypothetical protein
LWSAGFAESDTTSGCAPAKYPCRLSIIFNCSPIRWRLYSSMGFGLDPLQASPAFEGRIFGLAGVRHGCGQCTSAGGLLDVRSLIITPSLRQRHLQPHHAASAHRHAARLESHPIAHHHHPQALSRARDSLTKEPSATSTGCRSSPTRHRSAFNSLRTLLIHRQHLQTF